jgi:GNAT superfamily N-acetyltransferase
MTPSYSAATVTALVDALRDDPFYDAISRGFAGDEARRREGLARYFDYSMREGARLGRLVVLPDEAAGAAVWLLPAESVVYEAAQQAKEQFIAEVLGEGGLATYRQIISFMQPRAAAVIDESAWYLSIIGVAPSRQGQGIGKRLIEPTLAEADRAGVDCYLETYGSKSLPFYERMGFTDAGSHVEPVTGETYSIMRRIFTRRHSLSHERK